MRRILDRQVSLRQLMHLAIVVLVPYVVIGIVWAATHHEHLADLDGVDWLFSWIGEVIAWPPLVISDITLR